MAVRDITTLKSYFETGDIPTQAQFGDVFDTMFAGAVEIWDKDFGTVNNGETDDRLAAQAAINHWNTVRQTQSAVLRFSPKLRLNGGLYFGSIGGKRGAVLGMSPGMPMTEVIVGYHGYGADAGAAEVFQFGSPDAPAYQSGVEIGGFLFNRLDTSIRAPIGIAGAALAQSSVHDITFGGWNNEAISLLTPQNVRMWNISMFGGGRSFPAKDGTGITVTQSGTTLTASASFFDPTDDEKTFAVWGVSPNTHRRKTRVTTYTSATVVTVAEDFTDATPRRIFAASPNITTTEDGTTIVADAPVFVADLQGLPVCLDGAGENGGVHRAKIVTVAANGLSATISIATPTATTSAKIATAAMAIYSPESFGNGASDIRINELQIEQHTGVGLAVIDADILHVRGKFHALQSGGSEAAIWASRWEGSLDADFDAQYLGPHRMVVGDQTSALRVRPMRLRSAINEQSFRIRPRAATFDGAIVDFEGLYLVGAAAGTTPADLILDDNGTENPGYLLHGPFGLNQQEGVPSYVNNRVYASQDGLHLGAGDPLGEYRAPAAWTPVVADAATAGNVATGTFTGSWQRIGGMVHVSARLVDVVTSGMTGGNTLYIRGLPVAVRGGTLNLATGQVRVDNVTFSGQLVAFANDGNSYVTLYQNASGGASTLLTVAALASGTADLRFSLSYPAGD